MYNNIIVVRYKVIRMHVGHIIQIHQCFSIFLPQLSKFSPEKVKAIATHIVLQDKQRHDKKHDNIDMAWQFLEQFSGFIILYIQFRSLVACCGRAICLIYPPTIDFIIYIIYYKINGTLVPIPGIPSFVWYSYKRITLTLLLQLRLNQYYFCSVPTYLPIPYLMLFSLFLIYIFENYIFNYNIYIFLEL